MKTIINWTLSVLSAAVIQRALDYWLPISMERQGVIVISGVTAIFWLILISRPLDKWSKA